MYYPVQIEADRVSRIPEGMVRVTRKEFWDKLYEDSYKGIDIHPRPEKRNGQLFILLLALFVFMFLHQHFVFNLAYILFLLVIRLTLPLVIQLLEKSLSFRSLQRLQLIS